MYPDDVTSAIKGALSTISVARPGWQDDPNLSSAIDLEYIQALIEPLEAWPPAQRLRGRRITDGLGFGSSFDFRKLAQWLVYRSGSVGIGQALNEFEAFITRNATEMLTVLALGGIRPEGIVQLNSDIFLTPIELLPPSVLRNEALGYVLPVSLQMQPLRARPTAAIAIKYSLAVAIDPAESSSREVANAKSERDARLTEMQLCMGIAYKGVVDLIGAWSQPAHASIPAIFSAGALSFQSAGPPRRVAREVDHAEAKRIFTLFRRFRGDRISLHVPLQRLNSAMT